MTHTIHLPNLLLLLLCACTPAHNDRVPVPPPEWLLPQVYDSLKAAGARSIPGGDVPVAAAVIYRGRIVTGYNDVNLNANAAGHADINALTAAMRTFGGAEAFKQIDRDSLYLVTTWEPCPMCRGAIADEHRLKPENVVVLMPKDNELLQAERTHMERFEARHLYVDRADIQQDLFCQHPGYRKAYPHNCRQAQ